MKNIIWVLVLLCLGCKTPEIQKFDIVISNGNIIDLETGKITIQNIFITGGRIQKIASPDTTFLYDTKEKINATDKYIVPGFWDNHVHFRGGDSLIADNKNLLKLFIANGITTVRDAGGDLTTSVLAWRKQITAGKLIGPKIYTSGPKIDGPDGTWAGSLGVKNDVDIKKALDSLQSIPSDFVKIYDSKISPEAYLKTISETEKRNLITSGHMPFTVKLNDAVDAGIDAVEHLYYIMKGCSSQESEITQQLIEKKIGFWDAMPALISSYNYATAQNTFKNLKENNVYVVPTLHIGKTLSYLDEVDHSNDRYLKYISPSFKKTYQGRIKSAMNASKKARQDRKNLDAFFGELTKSLNDAGVGLLAGSDSGAYNSYTYPGVSLHGELEQMVANGISPLEALRTSAPNGSKFLKQTHDYGSLVKGKISDLVLLDANPLQDIRNTTKIHTVVKGNTVLNKTKLQELLLSLDAD